MLKNFNWPEITWFHFPFQLNTQHRLKLLLVLKLNVVSIISGMSHAQQASAAVDFIPQTERKMF
jgi:hypothetical protein